MQYKYVVKPLASRKYAYTIEDDTITIHDACHQQNMHD